MKQLSILFGILLLCLPLLAETFAAQGFEPGDTWSYQASAVGSGYWGLMDDDFGGASPHTEDQYWASWNMGGNEGIITFANLDLSFGWLYSLEFYYYTRLLNSPAEFSRYAISYDNGLSWTDWITLQPNTQAWTLVTVDIPTPQRQIMLKVSAKHSGTSKYAHWDSFRISREPTPPLAPVIENLQIAQRTDGSGLVDIHYDLFDANNDDAMISLLVSGNAGASYEIIPSPANLSGDIGPGITMGTAKHIIWDAGSEAIGFESDQYCFRLLAEDGTTYGTVATPVFDPPGGTCFAAQEVSISCATDGATIHYTVDGSEPDQGSEIYTSPINMSTDTILKAKAFKDGWMASGTAEAEYVINQAPSGFVYVPGGTFTMGGNGQLPVHSVNLNGFYIGNLEVTQGEWQALMGTNPAHSYGVGANYPVYYISWYAILKYCNLRSMEEGLTPVYSISGSTDPAHWGAVPTTESTIWNAAVYSLTANGYRLPTEAEWEYAARGATNIPDYLYSGSDDIAVVSWYAGNNSPNGSKQVGGKVPNGLGIHDMSGNVWEWVWDRYGSYSADLQDNPTGPTNGFSRVYRGGGWDDPAGNCMVTTRTGVTEAGYGMTIGFRLCRSVDSMVLVEGGTFNNGTSDVTLSSFFIDKYEVTQASYQAVMGTNPSHFSGNPYRPVEQVSWFNAIEYCNRRSIQEGLTPCYSYSTYGTNPDTWPAGWNTNDSNHNNVNCNWSVNGYRLPTEMEWMFAAKGGNQSQGFTYSGSNTIGNVAWYDSNSGYRTHDVGELAANELGTFDMSGNIYEWVWDIWNSSYPSGNQTNPTGPISGSHRMIRGGSWSFDASDCAVSSLGISSATNSGNDAGFRIARISP